VISSDSTKRLEAFTAIKTPLDEEKPPLAATDGDLLSIRTIWLKSKV
jgi:hypothetical protein